MSKNPRAALRTLVAALALVACAERPSLADDRCASLPEISLVTALDDSTRTTRTFEEERELREFALFSYRSLAGDIIDGRGAYLDALSEPFRTSCQSSDVLLEWFRQMLAAAGSATDFSRKMAVALASVRATRDAAAAGPSLR